MPGPDHDRLRHGVLPLATLSKFIIAARLNARGRLPAYPGARAKTTACHQDRPRHAECAAVQRVAKHHQAADVAARAAADLGGAVAIGRAAPRARVGKLLEGVRGRVGHGRW